MGRKRIGVGAVLVVVGVVGLVVGIVQAVQPDSDLLAEAVDTARTVEGGLLDVEAESAGDYTIYVVVPTGHLHSDDVPGVQQEAVHSVTCAVERPGEEPLTIRGDRHLTGQSTDDAASVGWFSTGAGEVRATCEVGDGDEGRTVLLVPGKPSIWAGGAVMAVGGSLIGLLGGALACWGAANRQKARLAAEGVASGT